jgi:hypothetical protein
MIPRTLGALALLALSSASASAQVTLTTNAAFNSSYVWRGLTFTNRPVAQLDAALGVPVAGGTLSAGTFVNLEPAGYAGAADISENGAGAAGLTEFDVFAEYGRTIGKASLAAGAIAFRFPNEAGLTKTYNTAEVYTRASFAVPLAPTVTVAYDVQKVRGFYLEGALLRRVPVTSKVGIDLGAAAGMSAGQHWVDGSGENANFEKNGLTHVDLSATTAIAGRGFTVAPTAHIVFGRDAYTRIVAPEQNRGTKLWIGAKVTWGHVFGATAEKP